VRAADIPVLGLEEGGSQGETLIRTEIEAAVREDGAEAIVLDCAGMADLAKRLSVDFGLPVIDGVAAAVKQVEGLIAQGLKTSKMGGYAMPPRKDYVGQFADYQPQP
jgi:allantoin racemase